MNIRPPALAAMLLLTSTATAQVQVHVVGPNQPFATIQAAIDAATDGDVVLVKAGSYPGFNLVAKGVTVAADVGEHVVVTNQIVIHDVAETSRIVLMGLETQPPWNLGKPGLMLDNVQAPVRLDSCTIHGATGYEESHGVRASNVADVALARCDVRAGKFSTTGSGSPTGVISISSNVAIYDSSVHGEYGGNSAAPCAGEDGGNGLKAIGGLVFASRSIVEAGAGGAGDGNGFGCCGGYGGNGGIGFELASGAQAWFLDMTVIGGPFGPGTCGSSGCCGADGNPGRATKGAVIPMSGTARHAPTLAPLREDESIPLALHGTPGTAVWLMRSQQPAFGLKLAYSGVLLIGPPQVTVLLGAYDDAGQLFVTLPAPGLPSSDEARIEYWQTVEFDGAWALGPPITVVVLDSAF